MTRASLNVAVVVAAVLIASFDICAQERRQTPPAAQGQNFRNRLAQMDKNGDGKISRDEATGRLKANFARVDADKDGFLNQQELRQLANRRGTPNAPNNQRTMSDEQLRKSAPEGVTVEPDIAYRPGESKAWRLDLARPTNDGDTPRPAIVFIHGGGWRSGDKRTGYFINGALEYAQSGYVCISVNYRLTGETKFPACIEDVKCAVRWLRANAKKYNVDPQRIGGYGNSAGAHLVAMLGLAGPEAKLEGDGPYQDQSSLLQAVCCSATPTDLTRFERLLEADAGSSSAPNGAMKDRLRQASPITYVSKTAPPFLVIHGTADQTVNVKHGDTFVKALKEAGAKSVVYIRIDGAGHNVFGANAKRTHPAMETFFAEHLAKN